MNGTADSRPPILIGSHVGSVTDGGNFDEHRGALGGVIAQPADLPLG